MQETPLHPAAVETPQTHSIHVDSDYMKLQTEFSMSIGFRLLPSRQVLTSELLAMTRRHELHENQGKTAEPHGGPKRHTSSAKLYTSIHPAGLPRREPVSVRPHGTRNLQRSLETIEG